MKSIFDLKTKNSDLSSANQGLTNYKYQEIQSIRSVTGANFGDSEIVYRWTYGSNKYWIPSKSYLKVRLQITRGNGNRLLVEDNLTFAMNVVPNMFQSATYKIADQTVCSVTQNLPQVDTLKNRMYHSGAWLNTMGSAMNNWDSSYHKRENAVLGSVDPVQMSWFDMFRNEANVLLDIGVTVGAGDSFTYTFNPASGYYDVHFEDNTNTAYNTHDGIPGLEVGDTITFVDGYTQFCGRIEEITATEWSVSSKIVWPDGTVDLDTASIELTLRRDNDHDHSGMAAETEFMWQPTLSIFDSVKHVIPCASTKHEFTVTPFPNETWQKNVIQSRGDNKDNGLGNDFIVTVQDLRFYILTCDSHRIDDNFEFMLDLNEIQCQRTPITARQQQQTVDVIPSTNGITLALQDGAAGLDTRYPLSRFTTSADYEYKLVRYYIRYEGQVPTPDFDGQWVRIGTANNALNQGRKDYLKDIYVRSKMYDGTMFLEHPESLAEFRSRGMYIYHPFPKTASSRNTRAYIQTNFSEDPPAQNPFLLVFSHYKKAVILTVQAGRIIEVRSFDA